MLRLPPLERVEAVRPFWQSLAEDKRAELLTITISKLRDSAKQIAKMAVINAGEESRTPIQDAWGEGPCMSRILELRRLTGWSPCIS